MLIFRNIADGDSWEGVDWVITDEDQLAELVARIALGQARHVQMILADTVGSSYPTVKSAADGAIRLLTASDPKKPWHRDGWLFQVLAWIAAHIHSPETLKSSPHMIHAHKGFDGIHLKLNASSEVTSIRICEQKATGSPRNKITQEVWPEFESLEAGKRDNELVAEITTLLDRHAHLNADAAISTILWDNVRSYSVAITIGDKENSQNGRAALFKGYHDIAPEREVQSRRAETFHQKNLRIWMKNFSEKAINAVKKLEAEVV